MRLIDADELIEIAHRIRLDSRERIEQMIESAPTVDVEVVKCKDCKWWKTYYSWNGNEHKICVREAYEPLRNAEDFCSRGERREDGKTD